MKQITRSEFKRIEKEHFPNMPSCLHEEDIAFYKDLGIEIIDDPVPLRLECEVSIVMSSKGVIVLDTADSDLDKLLFPFAGKSAKIIIEEKV